MHRLAICLLLATLFTGCTVSSSSHRDDETTTLNLGPIIGLIGWAVDGDDKDDYEHFFHDDHCHCHACRH